jgi:serine/threonine protein phosphatase PrpC
MGGMQDGARCAEEALGAFIAYLADHSDISPPFRLREAALSANSKVFSLFRGKGGSTLSAVLLRSGEAFTCHVGDSRIHAVADGGALLQLSTDDTVAAQLEAIGAAPRQPSPDHGQLVQYIGMGPGVEPHVQQVGTRGMSRLLLTSDGAYRPVAAVLPTLIRHAPSPKNVVERILALANWMGGNDNASVISIALPRPDDGLNDQFPPSMEIWGPEKTLEIVLAPAFSTVSGRNMTLSEAPYAPPAPASTSQRPRPPKRRRGKDIKSSSTDRSKLSIEIGLASPTPDQERFPSTQRELPYRHPPASITNQPDRSTVKPVPEPSNTTSTTRGRRR